MNTASRLLGNTGIRITPVALGLWPIAGMTSLDTNETDSLATIREAISQGINFFDTAYCYGKDGVSERLLGIAAGEFRDQIVMATKCGIRWASDGSRINDASPARLRLECDESLRRLNTDRVELMYLHSADGVTPIEESAAELRRIQQSGKAIAIGASNLNFSDLQRFHEVCPIDAVQYKFNMLQREIESDIVPWCRNRNISVVVYWPLMKGLLAGRMRRGWQFDPGDKRLTYPVFQEPQWELNQQFLDRLDPLASAAGVSISQLVVSWTIQRSGITSALCGAKRAWQIRETAAAMSVCLPESSLKQIDDAIAARERGFI